MKEKKEENEGEKKKENEGGKEARLKWFTF